MTPSTLLPTKNKFFVKRAFQRLNCFAVYYLRADNAVMKLLELESETDAKNIAAALNVSMPRSHCEIQQELIHWINTAKKNDPFIDGYMLGIIRALLWANGFDPLMALDMAEGIAQAAQTEGCS